MSKGNTKGAGKDMKNLVSGKSPVLNKGGKGNKGTATEQSVAGKMKRQVVDKGSEYAEEYPDY